MDNPINKPNCKNLEDALCYLSHSVGAAVLQDGKKTCAMVADLIPTMKMERHLLGTLYDCGGAETLLKCAGEPPAKRDMELAKLQLRMVDEWGISPENAALVCTSFWNAQNPGDRITAALHSSNPEKEVQDHHEYRFVKSTLPSGVGGTTSVSHATRQAGTSKQQPTPNGYTNATGMPHTAATHSVVFRDCRGNILLKKIYHDGERIVAPTPGKSPDETNLQYKFMGWRPGIPATATSDGDYTAVFAAAPAKTTPQAAKVEYDDYKKHYCSGLQGMRNTVAYFFLIPFPCVYCISIFYNLFWDIMSSEVEDALFAIAIAILIVALITAPILLIVYLSRRSDSYDLYKKTGKLQYGGPYEFGTMASFAKQFEPKLKYNRELSLIFMYLISVTEVVAEENSYLSAFWEFVYSLFNSDGWFFHMVFFTCLLAFIIITQQLYKKFKLYIQGGTSVK